MMRMQRLRGQCAAECPSVIDTRSDCFLGETVAPRPLRKAERFTVESQQRGTWLTCRRQCALHRPRVQPRTQDAACDTEAPRPLRQRQGLVVERDAAIGDAVVRLRFSTGPITIVRRVAAVIVAAFKCVSQRTWAKIGDERAVVSPTIAHSDSTPPVSRVVAMLMVVATTFHGDPHVVLACVLVFSGRAVQFPWHPSNHTPCTRAIAWV